MANPIPPSNIHPVFQSCSFIDDVELKDHIYKVMQDDSSNILDATLPGGIEGRVITNKYSNCLCQLIDCIVRFFQKVLHNMCMACCSGYRDKFNHAAEKITLAAQANVLPNHELPSIPSQPTQTETVTQQTNLPNNETVISTSNNETRLVDTIAQNTIGNNSNTVVENPSQTQQTLAIPPKETFTPTDTNSSNPINTQVNQIQTLPQTINSSEQTTTIPPVQNPQLIQQFIQANPTSSLNQLTEDSLKAFKDLNGQTPVQDDTSKLLKKETWFEIETFFKDKGLNLVAEMFALLLKKDPSAIIFWNVNEATQTFSIGFTQTLRLYVPTEFNPGGGVFILGDNKNKLITGKWVKDFSEFKLKAEKQSNNLLKSIRDEFNKHLPKETQNGSIKGVTFTQGFEVYSKGSVPGKSSVDYFMEMSSEQIMIGYSWLLNVYGQARAIQDYRTQWASPEMIEDKNGMSKRIDEAKSQKMDELD